MKILLWDFDGTLVHSENFWSNALLQALDTIVPNHNIKIEELKIHLSKGFPWHEPEKEHLNLCKNGEWWRYMESYFSNIYQNLGYDKKFSSELARSVHNIVLDCNLYNVDSYAIPVLSELKKEGWKNYILSNHIPELPQIIDELGFSDIIESCYSSANIGYEKPNLCIYKYVFERIGKMKRCIMIGDSYYADILGAEGAGLD